MQYFSSTTLPTHSLLAFVTTQIEHDIQLVNSGANTNAAHSSVVRLLVNSFVHQLIFLLLFIPWVPFSLDSSSDIHVGLHIIVQAAYNI